MFYMAHFPPTLGAAALSNQGLPLAVLQAGFSQMSMQSRWCQKVPEWAPGAEFLLLWAPRPTPTPQPAAPRGCIAANPPHSGLILIAGTSVSIMASKRIVVLCVIQATTSTSYHNALPEHDTESVKFHFLVPQIPM